MALVMQKTYECMTCKKQIRLSKIDNPQPGQKKKWDKYEPNGVTPHVCSNNNSDKETTTNASSPATNSTEELRALRDLLIAATSRIDAIIVEKH